MEHVIPNLTNNVLYFLAREWLKFHNGPMSEFGVGIRDRVDIMPWKGLLCAGYSHPRSQALFPTPPPRRGEKKTLVEAGHVSLGQRITYGRSPQRGVIASQNYCLLENEVPLKRNAIMFMQSLHYAIAASSYSNLNLKPKQVKCMEAVYRDRDLVAILPTGYGKSIIFHLLPSLLFDRNRFRPLPSTHSPVVLMVSPLNSLIQDQLRRINAGNISAAVLKAKRDKKSDDSTLDMREADAQLLKDAKYDILFTHPEACLSCKGGQEMLQSEPYQRAVQAIVIDEAHCILEW